MSVNPQELDIPEDVLDAEINAKELLRFWIVDNEECSEICTGAFSDNTEEAKLWGAILADIAWQAVNQMLLEDRSRGGYKQMMSELRRGFNEQMQTKRNIEDYLKAES